MVFQIIGIGILLSFYGCYFLKMINQKKQGIQTDQIGKGKTGNEYLTYMNKVNRYLARR